jgi:hypothetical protein
MCFREASVTELRLTFEGEDYYCGARGSEVAHPKPTDDAHRCCGRAEIEGARKQAGQVGREYDNLINPFTVRPIPPAPNTHARVNGQPLYEELAGEH